MAVDCAQKYNSRKKKRQLTVRKDTVPVKRTVECVQKCTFCKTKYSILCAKIQFPQKETECAQKYNLCKNNTLDCAQNTIYV